MKDTVKEIEKRLKALCGVEYWNVKLIKHRFRLSVDGFPDGVITNQIELKVYGNSNAANKCNHYFYTSGWNGAQTYKVALLDVQEQIMDRMFYFCNKIEDTKKAA